MRTTISVFFFALGALAATPLCAANTGSGGGTRLIAELSAGPLIGVDRPIRGCAGKASIGLALPPFEVGVSCGAAYDAAFDLGLLNFEAQIGLGSGLRAIIGGLLPLGALALRDSPSGSGEMVPLKAASWPDRFGIAATVAQLPWRLLGARLDLEAELVFTDYSVLPEGKTAAAALSGESAFAAGVEATLALRLGWGEP